MEQKFTINGRLPGLNEYTNANRSNRYGRSNLKKQTESLIIYQIKVAHLHKIKRPCFFTFTWYEATKRRDKDNVAFAKKFIFDALQKSGVLPNDNNDYVIGFADHFVYNKGQKVTVEISECDETNETDKENENGKKSGKGNRQDVAVLGKERAKSEPESSRKSRSRNDKVAEAKDGGAKGKQKR